MRLHAARVAASGRDGLPHRCRSRREGRAVRWKASARPSVSVPGAARERSPPEPYPPSSSSRIVSRVSTSCEHRVCVRLLGSGRLRAEPLRASGFELGDRPVLGRLGRLCFRVMGWNPPGERAGQPLPAEIPGSTGARHKRLTETKGQSGRQTGRQGWRIGPYCPPPSEGLAHIQHTRGGTVAITALTPLADLAQIQHTDAGRSMDEFFRP